jgi:hypothetical protein
MRIRGSRLQQEMLDAADSEWSLEKGPGLSKASSGAGGGMQAAGLGEDWAVGRRRQSIYTTNRGGTGQTKLGFLAAWLLLAG